MLVLFCTPDSKVYKSFYSICQQAGTGHLSLMIKLESDVKRLKCDLQLSRNRENELRDQIVCYMSRCLLVSI